MCLHWQSDSQNAGKSFHWLRRQALTALVIEAKDRPGGQPQFLYGDKRIVVSGNSAFIASVFSSFEDTSQGAGISLCKASGLVVCGFCV